MCEHIAPVLNSRSRLYIFTSDLEGGAISKAAVTSSFSSMMLHIDIDIKYTSYYKFTKSPY